MRPQPRASRIFIVGFKDFEIYYLPESNRIVSRLEVPAEPAGALHSEGAEKPNEKEE